MSFWKKIFGGGEKPKSKSWEEFSKDPGAFLYDETGFTITSGKSQVRINWNEITQINAFKEDIATTDLICIEIVRGTQAIKFHEEFPGFHFFNSRMLEKFPTIPKDWDVTISQPPFQRNYTRLFEKRYQVIIPPRENK